MSQKKYVKAEWLEGVLSPESVDNINNNSYSVMFMCEAKRILEKQRKEHAPLIAKLKKRQQVIQKER